jgi:cobalt-zinc-cadmium efflux system membrane fusion protein
MVLVLGLATMACRAQETKPERTERRDGPRTVSLAPQALDAAGVELIQSSRASFRPSVSAGGFIRPDARRSVTVRAPGEGRVVRVAVDVGAIVKAGDTLVVVESPEANAALSRHRAAAARESVARRALERAERLLGLQGISRAERDSRQADAEAAAAEADAARRDLARLGLDSAGDEARLTLRAPLAGTVLEVSAVEGGLVQKDAAVAVIADLAQVWVLLEMVETEAARVETGGTVEVRSEAFPDQVFKGWVALVEPTLGESAGRVRVRVVLDNASRALKPGRFVTAQLLLAGHGAEGTAVPSEALQRLFGLTAVFVETAPGTFELRSVETGRESAGKVEVLRGLRDGERVVTRGAFVLKSELLKSSVAVEDEK